MELWWRFAELRYWWMHAMVLLWLVFSVMLFVLEPLVLHRVHAQHASHDAAASLRRTFRLHVALLAGSVLTIAGAVAGSHGVLLFP